MWKLFREAGNQSLLTSIERQHADKPAAQLAQLAYYSYELFVCC